MGVKGSGKGGRDGYQQHRKLEMDESRFREIQDTKLWMILF